MVKMTHNDDYFDKLNDKEKKLLAHCRMYIACVNMRIDGSARISAHEHIAKALGQDVGWGNKPLCDILHKLDEVIGLPIEPSAYATPDANHPYFKHPDRNLSHIELVTKYEIKLFELLKEKFLGDENQK